jgi:hypothetical protein
MKRCPNGSRRNKKTKQCEKYTNKQSLKKVTNKTVKKRNKTVKNRTRVNSIAAKLEPLIKNKNKHLIKVLEMSCKRSTDCLAVGHYREYVKSYFDNFRDLSMIKKITEIESESGNGILYILNFVKDKYIAHAVLKTNDLASADNLYYEYYVGKYFINKYVDKYPCFIETYDFYRFNSKTASRSIIHSDLSKLIHLENTTQCNKRPCFDWNSSCINPTLNCFTMQFFDNWKPMARFNVVDNYVQLICAMYQVYFPLSVLESKFTHYDLHDENVFLYKPFNDKKSYVLMRYHTKHNYIIEFPTNYIAKIIDYGRCYFNNGEENSYNIINKHIFKSNDCDGYGRQQGYAAVPNNSNTGDDLMLASMVHIDSIIGNLTNNKIKLKIGFDGGGKKYATSTTSSSSFDSEESDVFDYVSNVYSFRRFIEENFFLSNKKLYISLGTKITWSELLSHSFAKYKHAATMNIYEDGRDYTFTLI